MPASVQEWYDQHTDRALQHQSNQLATSKLVVTFFIGVAARLVATALQVAGNRLLDILASRAVMAEKSGGERAPAGLKDRVRASIRTVVLEQADVTVESSPGTTTTEIGVRGVERRR